MTRRPPSSDRARLGLREWRTRRERIPPEAGRLGFALLRATRPVQWVKNLACLAGLIFSGRLFLASCQLRAFAGFWTFCLISSAVYLLNDLLDRERDRLNPRTARRPIASGELPVVVAWGAFGTLLLAALGFAACLGGPCLATLSAYFAANVAYGLRIKRLAIADVMCIALGFVLRMLFGVYAVNARPTPWIVLCMFFLALFLGFAKRRGELVAGGGRPADARAVLEQYNQVYLDALLSVSATLTILCYAMFTVLSQKNPTLVVTVLPVVYCVMLYLLQIHLHARGESPDRILVSDKRLWIGILTWVGLYVSIYYNGINIF